MPCRRNLDLEKLRASLDVPCPIVVLESCRKISNGVDWDHLECPACGERFVPKSGKRE